MSGDTDGDETAGVVREWSPLGTLVARLPWRAELTSVAAAPDVLALGTRAGRLYWYDRRRDLLQPLPDDVRSAAPVSRLHLASSVEHMLAAGSTDGRLTVYRLPRDCAGAMTDQGPPPERCLCLPRTLMSVLLLTRCDDLYTFWWQVHVGRPPQE